VTDFGTNQKLIYDFILVINTNLYLLSYTVSKLWLIIGQIFANERGVRYGKPFSHLIDIYRYLQLSVFNWRYL